MISRKNIKLGFYYLLLFYFIYTPEIFIVAGIPLKSQVIVFVSVFFIISKELMTRIVLKKFDLEWDENLFILFLGVILSTIYSAVVALLTNNDPRILQNIYVLFQLIVLIHIFKKMGFLGFDRFEKIKALYKVASIQGVFCLIMLFIPGIRKLALRLYYLDRQENEFISSMRIYGISGEYTFFTPIYHGLLISIAVYLFLYERQKFLKYIPFIFIATVLNGRTGIIIAVVGSMIVLLLYAISNISKFYKVIFISISFLIMSTVSILFIKIFLLPTYNWLMSSFEELFSFFSDGSKVGTLETLSSMFLLPEGKRLIFGEGFRVYGNRVGLVHSDIGYVNDLFLGGIIYCLILYATEIVYIVKYNYLNNVSEKLAVSSVLLFTLGLSNYKGESARGGLILIGVILIKYLLDKRY